MNECPRRGRTTRDDLPDHVKIEGDICKEGDDQPKDAARAGKDHRAWSLRGNRLCITWPPASADAVRPAIDFLTGSCRHRHGLS